MGADDLRHLRETLGALKENVAEVGTILRRLRRGVRHAERRLDIWADAVSVQARRAADSSADGWPQDRHEFGRAVLRGRESANLTRPKLAALVGVSDTTIRNIEKGNRCRDDVRRWLVQTFAALELRRENIEP